MGPTAATGRDPQVRAEKKYAHVPVRNRVSKKSSVRQLVVKGNPSNLEFYILKKCPSKVRQK